MGRSQHKGAQAGGKPHRNEDKQQQEQLSTGTLWDAQTFSARAVKVSQAALTGRKRCARPKEPPVVSENKQPKRNLRSLL